ncbi:hypothetical protein [Streptosporangium sp. NPDC006007]
MAAVDREGQGVGPAIIAHPIFGGLVLLSIAMAVGEIVLRRKR